MSGDEIAFDTTTGGIVMIHISHLTKTFCSASALSNVNLEIPDNAIFGLLGTNGAGKSTLLRILAGILNADSGEIFIDGEKLTDTSKVRQMIFYLSDDQYYFPGATPQTMLFFYEKMYPGFDRERFLKLLSDFQLDSTKKLHTFSKGMKKQVFLIAGICCNAPILLCDEVFDGLDPVVRQSVKNLLQNELRCRPFTPVIASHNLSELEGLCQHIGILHRGGILLSREITALEYGVHKFQCVFSSDEREFLFHALTILRYEQRGFLTTMLVRGDFSEIQTILASRSPVCYESLPLSLEEIFIYETERIGYDIKELIY